LIPANKCKAKARPNALGKDLEVFVKVSFLAFAKNFDFSSNLLFPLEAYNKTVFQPLDSFLDENKWNSRRHSSLSNPNL
jgi:hypothetical protein